MAYNRNIPASTDLISNSQSQIQGNFQTIDSGTTGTGVGVSRNHVTMTDATNGGLHHEVDFYQNVTDPTISGFVSSLYPKLISSESELFFKNGARTLQMTGATTVGAAGSVTLQGGVILKWGKETSPANNTTVTFATPFPTACYAVIVTGGRPSGTQPTINVNPASVSTTVFVFKINAESGEPATAAYWVAIGS